MVQTQRDGGDVIELFLRATETMVASRAAKLWTAVSLVSALAGRKVWTSTYRGKPLYANMFIFLVGEPGKGKSDPMDFAEKLARSFEVPDGHVVFCPDEVTPAAFKQYMGETFSETNEAEDADERKFHSFYTLISEWAGFVAEPDAQFNQGLARLWDCPLVFRKWTKEHGKDRLFNPYLTVLAGVQPDWFAHGFPRGSFKLGFAARTVWVWATGQVGEKKLFTPAPTEETVQLVKLLERAREVSGEVQWAPEAQVALQQWWSAGAKPRPEEPLLEHYCTRRDMHLAKLALVCVLSRGGSRVELVDFERALGYLVEVEQDMPKAVAMAGENPLTGVSDLAVAWVKEQAGVLGGPVPETALRRHIARMVRPQEAGLLVNELIAQGRLIVPRGSDALSPNRLLIPGAGE